MLFYCQCINRTALNTVNAQPMPSQYHTVQCESFTPNPNCPQHSEYSSSPPQLRIRINLRPSRFHLRTFRKRLLAVLLGSLKSLGAQTHVDLVFGIVAHADGFVEETTGVAFIEGVHDIFAVFILTCVEMGMHCVSSPLWRS